MNNETKIEDLNKMIDEIEKKYAVMDNFKNSTALKDVSDTIFNSTVSSAIGSLNNNDGGKP